jgi:MFS family permease
VNSPVAKGSLRFDRLTIGVLLGISIIGFESLGIATALPVVSDALNGKSLYGWAFSAFLLGQLLGTVLAGTAADRIGSRRPMACALALFATGLLIGTAASSMAFVVVGRAVAGAGSGAALMLNFAVIGTSYDESVRPRMVAATQTAWVLPALIGPAIAGPVAEHVSWRLVFGALAPVLAVVAWLVLPVLTTAPISSGGTSAGGERFVTATGRDRVFAALTVTAGGAALIVALDSPVVWRGVVIGVLGLVLCIFAGRVLFPAGTIRGRHGLASIVLAYSLLLGGFIGIEAFFPRALDDVRGMSAFVGGLFLSGGTVSWSAGAWLQSKRAYWWLRPSVRSISALVLAVGVVVAGVSVVSGAPIPLALLGWVIAGLGMGTAFNAVTEAMYRSTPPERIGAATSATQLGGSLVGAVAAGTNGTLNNIADRLDWMPRSAAWLVLAFQIGVMALVVLGVSRMRVEGE